MRIAGNNTQSYPIPSVRAIIENDQKDILLLKRSLNIMYGGKWCLPGGKIDFGYSVVDTIKKEIKEETNLDCSKPKFLFYMDGLPSEKYDVHYIIFYFKCEVKGEIRLNQESEEYRWVSIKDINKYEVVFGNEKGIEMYVANLE